MKIVKIYIHSLQQKKIQDERIPQSIGDAQNEK